MAKLDGNELRLLANDNEAVTADETHRRELAVVFRELRSYALSNAEFYRESGCREDAAPARRRLHLASCSLHEHLERGIQPGVDYLLGVACLYDLDSSTMANGYRSIIHVVERCCHRLLVLSRYIACHRESLLFRAEHYSLELDAFVTTLGQLRACLYYLHKLVSYCQAGYGKCGGLFPDEYATSMKDRQVAQQMMNEFESLCQDSFYGRCLGFQFCESMVRPLTTINLVLASFSEGYIHGSAVRQIASSVLSSGKYIMDPDSRGQQVVNATRNGDIGFCKAFWSLAENSLMHKVPSLVCPYVRVNHVFTLLPEPFELPHVNGRDTVMITVPCAHTGPGSVSVRLISHELRQGQEVLINQLSNTNVSKVKSPGLIIQCHGGGFVAQSSASHQVYLRHWACDTTVPILCVDYSLAPELTFPRQLEEVFFAYCWAVKNCHLLGSTGQRVCLVGDSAGATLAVATAMRAASFGVRAPDAVLSVYGCMLVKYTPSPSRMLSIMDPLLPLGVLPKCLSAYAGISLDGDKDKPSSVFQFPAVNTDDRFMSASNDAVFMTGQVEPTVADETSKTSSGTAMYASDDSGFVDGTSQTLSSQSDVQTSSQISPLNSRTTSQTISQFETMSQTTSSQSSSKTILQTTESSATIVSKPSSLPPSHAQLKLNLDVVSRHKMSSVSVSKSSSTPAFATPVESPSQLDVENDAFVSPKPSSTFCTPTYAKMRHFAQSPIQPFSHIAVNVTRNPYMSPLLAGDDLLADMCPVYFVTCHLDPMLDDSISFAQRLRKLSRLAYFDVVDGLPHGFLNFVLMSSEAKAASDLCVRRLRQMLCIDVPPTRQ